MNTRLVIAAVAVGSAVFALAFGVPRLLQRARQDDALRVLTQLVRSASVYYVKPRVIAKTSDRAPCAFPLGEIRTSMAKSCCDPAVANADRQCDPAKIEWNRTIWSALKWKAEEPHDFIYAYEGTGTFGDARFTVTAYGDADCDGVYSTFQYVGRGGKDSRPDDCVLTDTPTFTAVQPDE